MKIKKQIQRALGAASITSLLAFGAFGFNHINDMTLIVTSAQTQNNVSSEQFIHSAVHLPSVAAIKNMTQNQLNQVGTDAHYTRHLHNQLSVSARRNQTVLRWEGYLTLKENAIQETHGSHFIQKVMALPNVSALSEMSYNQLANTQQALLKIRSQYHSLPESIQTQTNIARWEGFLTAKETATSHLYSEEGAAFVNAVVILPSASAIHKMSSNEILNFLDETTTLRRAYENLSSGTQKHVDVVKWEGYLSLKEGVAYQAKEELPEDIFLQFKLQLFNDEFLVLVNAERNRLGIHSLYYDEGLQLGTNVRAVELVEIGGLRVNGVPHVRPDGSSWVGAFDNYNLSSQNSYASGENLAMSSYTISESGSFGDYIVEDHRTLEQALANIFYEMYSNSPGHYENMIASHHNGFAVSISSDLHSESYYNRLDIYNAMVFSAEYE